MDTSSIATLSQCLGASFSGEDAVRLAYVFGSQVEGNTGPLSDLDVGVLVTDACLDDVTACRARLAHEVRKRVDIDDVDLVILNRAPIELAHRYLEVDWDEVHAHLHQLDDLDRFAQHVRHWLRKQE